MKTLLKYLSRKTTNPLFRLAIGAAYGNLALYGYIGTGVNVFKVGSTILEGEINKWRMKQKSV
jgi:hypothetical protein